MKRKATKENEYAIPQNQAARWKRRDRKRNPTMQVSGRGVKRLAALLENKKKFG
ncbi:MAG: hypothetical protein WC817_04565 [Patescibacteria group bacterium]|jgi:hypothetical protein